MSALLIQDPGSASGPRRLVPIETDAGLLGVEAPPAFAVRLDGGIQLHVTDRADHSAAGFSLIADPGTARRLYFSFAPGVHVLLLPPAASGAGRWREARTGG